MPTNQSKGRTGRQRKFLSKSSLLPMDSASARQLALTHQLALAACRGNGGNKHLINELTRAVYLTYFLQQMGFGALPFDAYMKAEAAISTALKNAERDGDWKNCFARRVKSGRDTCSSRRTACECSAVSCR